MKRVTAVLFAAVVLTATMASGVIAAPKDGMVLECKNTNLTLMRANGSNWWGLDGSGEPDGSVYVSEYVLVEGEDGVVFEKHYGKKTGLGEPVTCLADHFEFDWTVRVVQAT